MTPSCDACLSYSRADEDAVGRLREHLAGAGLRAFQDRHGLPSGQPWQPRLEAALEDCRALVVVLGPSGIGTWQHREIMLGTIRQADAEKGPEPFPVIPVLLPRLQNDAVPLGTFLSLNTWVDLRTGLDEAEPLQRLVAGIQSKALDGVARDRLLAQHQPLSRPPALPRAGCRPLLRPAGLEATLVAIATQFPEEEVDLASPPVVPEGFAERLVAL